MLSYFCFIYQYVGAESQDYQIHEVTHKGFIL